MEKKRGKELSVLERMGSGFIAGGVGKSSVAPFQRIQIMYQVVPGQTLSLKKGVETTMTVIRNEGFFKLWRGNIANCARSAPTAAVKFYTQSAYYNLYSDNKFYKLGNSAAQFCSGASSGVTTVVATYPMDLFRTKLAANSQYKGYVDCTMQTVRAHGIKGLYHGMSAPVVGSIPHTGVAFWSYDLLKGWFGLKKKDAKISPLKRTCAGFLAGFAGQTITYPFSTIRRRMQTSPEWKAKGLIGCFIHAVRHEGVKGLFRAYSIHAFKGPVSAGISFAVNDMVKVMLYDYHAKQEDEETANLLTVAATEQAK